MVNYNKLLHMLVDRKMSLPDLARKAGLDLQVPRRLKHGSYLNLRSIEKICKALECEIGDILEFREDSNG